MLLQYQIAIFLIAGCGKKLIAHLSEFVPSRIVYVSCEPATLVRDLSIFSGLGYISRFATAFDLFPTLHMPRLYVS